MNIEDIKELIDKSEVTNKTLIISNDTFFQLSDEIYSLDITFVTSDRLPKDIKAVVVDGDIFDSIYYLEKGVADE